MDDTAGSIKKKKLVFIFSIFFALGLVFFCAEKITKKESKETLFSPSAVFVDSASRSIDNSLEISFLQNNSVFSISSPAIISSKSLGVVFDKTDTKKEITEYIVKKGDTLSSIADKFGISLETILWANHLKKNSVITPGKKLIILPVSGVLYTVQKNDTLSGIAKRFKTDIDKIIEFNGLSNADDIYIGDTLILPGAKMPTRKVVLPALTPVASSYFIFPCEGVITQGLHYYNAVDIANKCGKPVVASATGIVQRTGWVKFAGRRVTILHPNGVVTYYAHLSKILVKPGQKVNAGDIIGYIGNSGHTIGRTGCHLHFEVIGAKNFLAKYPVGTWISWKK